MDNKDYESLKLTENQHAKIREALKIVEDQITYLISLMPEERDRAFEFGYHNVPFVRKSRDFIMEDPANIPDLLNLEHVICETEVIEDLATVLHQIIVLKTKVEDTMGIMGEDVFASMCVYYGYTKYNARMGSVDAQKKYEELRRLL